MNTRQQGLRAHLHNARVSFGLRWKRRRLLLRAIRAQRDLVPIADRTGQITQDAILVMLTVRNEALRLPFFLEHYRKLGVGHFLVVDNDSDDGTVALLRDQPDVSLWSAHGSYREARFGLDWSNGLLRRFAHGHWTLTVDADELLVYPYWETRDLRALTYWLDRNGTHSFAAMMLDLYPKGPVTDVGYQPGDDPCKVLTWFDAGNLAIQVQPVLQNLWIQGGVRARAFFSQTPRRSPTMNKIPLVKWNSRYAYVNSTHSVLPRRLNRTYAIDGGEMTSGLLLHTKFLPLIAQKSQEELIRRQHFAEPDAFVEYHQNAAAGPDLWCLASTRIGGWRKFEALGLMSRGGWV
jgi:Glycosyl transferase family 2